MTPRERLLNRIDYLLYLAGCATWFFLGFMAGRSL